MSNLHFYSTVTAPMIPVNLLLYHLWAVFLTQRAMGVWPKCGPHSDLADSFDSGSVWLTKFSHNFSSHGPNFRCSLAIGSPLNHKTLTPVKPISWLMGHFRFSYNRVKTLLEMSRIMTLNPLLPACYLFSTWCLYPSFLCSPPASWRELNWNKIKCMTVAKISYLIVSS